MSPHPASAGTATVRVSYPSIAQDPLLSNGTPNIVTAINVNEGRQANNTPKAQPHQRPPVGTVVARKSALAPVGDDSQTATSMLRLGVAKLLLLSVRPLKKPLGA